MTSRPLATFAALVLWLPLVVLWLALALVVAVLRELLNDVLKVRKATCRRWVPLPRFPSVRRIAAWWPGRRRQPFRPVVAMPGRRRLDMSAREREALVLFLRRRDGDLCPGCGDLIDFEVDQSDPWAEEVDHIVPFSLGGDCHVDNFQLLHAACNRRKGNRIDLRRVA